MDIQALKTMRATLVTQVRSITDKAADEKRTLLDATEVATIKNTEAEIDKLDDQIQMLERQEKREAAMAQREPRRVNQPAMDDPGPSGRFLNLTETYDAGTRRFSRAYGATPSGVRGTQEYRDAFNSYLETGRFSASIPPAIMNALQADGATAGGFTVAPQQFVAELIQALDNQVYIRQFATVRQLLGAESIGFPSLDADPADHAWTTELQTGSEDSTMAFGKREMRPWPLAKLIKVSNKLLRTSAIPVESLVRDRFAYKNGVVLESAYMTGTGAQQPLGLFTASANGIPTTRDVSTGNSTTAIGADGLVNAKYAVKGQYMARGAWIFHRDAIKAIRKLKDGNGQYLWQPGLSGAQPDRILDSPFLMSEYAPNTFTTGLYVGLFGDLSFYWIVDALQFVIQRLVELYAATNQVGFISRYEGDGMPVLSEAFARVTLA